MGKVTLITSNSLDRALSRVQDELIRQGLWDDQLQAVDVYLVPCSPWPWDWSAYGWQLNDGTGEIDIPAVSLGKLLDWLRGEYKSLADVLRHEYGHAIADTHRGLFRAQCFTDAFGATYQNEDEWEYEPEYFLTEYAATNAGEDFAETFMFFLRHDGRLPSCHDTPTIRQKWQFLERLCPAVKDGKRCW